MRTAPRCSAPLLSALLLSLLSALAPLGASAAPPRLSLFEPPSLVGALSPSPSAAWAQAAPEEGAGDGWGREEARGEQSVWYGHYILMSDLASVSGGVLSVYMSQEYEGVGSLLALMSVINFLVTPQIIHFANLEGRRSAPGERVVRSLLLRAGIPVLLGVITIWSLFMRLSGGSIESVVFFSSATIISVPVGALIDIALARRPRGAARAAAPPLTPAALTARALERPERLPSWVVGGE